MTLVPVASREEDTPAFILVHIERLLTTIALADLKPNNLVYMLTWLQWESMIHYFRQFHPDMKPADQVAFIHYKGITMMPPRTPPT